MRNFYIFILIIFTSLFLWVLSFPRSLNKEEFLNEKVLAKTTPFDVRIDVDLIKSLSSAYE